MCLKIHLRLEVLYNTGFKRIGCSPVGGQCPAQLIQFISNLSKLPSYIGWTMSSKSSLGLAPLMNTAIIGARDKCIKMVLACETSQESRKPALYHARHTGAGSLTHTHTHTHTHTPRKHFYNSTQTNQLLIVLYLQKIITASHFAFFDRHVHLGVSESTFLGYPRAVLPLKVPTDLQFQPRGVPGRLPCRDGSDWARVHAGSDHTISSYCITRLYIATTGGCLARSRACRIGNPHN